MASLIARSAPLLLVALLSACSTLPGLKSAREADFTSLRRTLATAELTPHQVRQLARETLSAEVVRAKDREDRPFVSGLRGCARPLVEALEERSATRDGVGAEAALLLLEAGRLEGSTRKFADEKDGAWRALSARAATRDADLRRKYFSDDDERVRRAALSAALEAADPGDVEELLEVSRLDPDPLTRNRAFQTLGRIGGREITLALKDRFQVADEELRLAIVDAWSQPGLYEQGGRQELQRLLSRESGFDSLHAARVLAQEQDETLRNQGLTRLVRFSEDGTAEERRMALRLLPGNRAITVKQLLRLTRGDDQQVAVIAWARLLGNKSHRSEAFAALSQWASSSSSLGFQARAALSASGDVRVLPLMLKQMKEKDPENRKIAGYGLVRLGAFSQLAPLLADEDAEVRRTVACRTLARSYLPAR